MSTPTYTHDVFLSYSSKDKAIVRSLAERLRGDGLKVWFDDWALNPGDNIPAKIEEGLEASRVLVFCMSVNAFGSDWAQLERQTFRFRDPLNRERRFVPLRLDDAPIRNSLAQFAYINWISQNCETGYSQLFNAIRQAEEYGRGSYGQAVDASLEPLLKIAPKNAVRALHIAEDRFLQVLLSKFTLTRRNEKPRSGIELSISFDDDTPAIWGQEGKRYLRSILPVDKRRRFQKGLDEFILDDRGSRFEVDDPEFFFRYASGGTLPIIEFEDSTSLRSYYCLFYRDVHPIGWNIANGGTDARSEFLDPVETIQRELREELIIADFERAERYVFSPYEGECFHHPAHATARRLWKRKFPNRDLNGLKVTVINVEWKSGPDSVVIRLGNEEPVRGDGFYLNINGEDFGIEFDRVAVIRLPDRVTLFDGEIDGGHLVSSPVGLFEVERFDSALRENEVNYVPDIFYFGDKRYEDGAELAEILKGQFVEHLRTIRTEKERDELVEAITNNRHYHLCPVTEKLAKRYALQKTVTRAGAAGVPDTRSAR